MGGYFTDEVGSNHITEVITGVGRVGVGDPRLFALLDTHIWPPSSLYFRHMKQHYFTYLRQYEVDHGLKPAGNESRTDVRFYQGSKAMAIASVIRSWGKQGKEWLQRLFAGD